MVELAAQNERIVGITPAMPTGSSLKYMMAAFPDRAYDVGIAEQHAVTLAAGLAKEGMIPYCNIYSTFAQRAYDQIIHDVALQNLPVIFCLDRAGLVGQDGPTHHGVFDIAFLNCIPNLTIAAPSSARALRNLLYTSQLGLDHPLVIRYPRGRAEAIDWQLPFEQISWGEANWLQKGDKIAVLSVGPIRTTVTKAIEAYPQSEKISHVDVQFIKPLNTLLLDEVFKTHDYIVTIEDGCRQGGYGASVVNYAHEAGYKGQIKVLGVPDEFISHGTVQELHDICGTDEKQLIHCFENFQ